VLGLLKKISFSGGKVLFVSTQPKLARLTRVMGEQSGHFYLARKWAPGLLTNWDKKRLQVRRAKGRRAGKGRHACGKGKGMSVGAGMRARGCMRAESVASRPEHGRINLRRGMEE
jgi:ribosomal protein S2